MEKFLDGLPSTGKTSRMRHWEWRNNAIYTQGSQLVEDLRIRFGTFLPDIVDVGTVPWFQQNVGIVRVGDGLSWFICAELAAARGDYDLELGCIAKAEAALLRVFNADVQADQRVNIRRRPRTGRAMGRAWY